MKNSTFTIRGLLIATGVIAFSLALLMYVLPKDPFSGRNFDRAVWMEFANDYVDDNPSGAMVQDIQQRHLVTGMSRAEVIELLGEPESVYQNGDFSYIVGMWSGFRIDHDGLEIYFDQHGKLTDSACVQY